MQAAQKRLQVQQANLQQQLQYTQVVANTPATASKALEEEDTNAAREQLLASQLRWLLQYAQQMDRVSGFFEPQLLQLYWRLFLLQGQQLRAAAYKAHGATTAESQRLNGRGMPSAAVGEIGVFHGKSFLPLWALRSEGEAAVAIDLFEGKCRAYCSKHWYCSASS